MTHHRGSVPAAGIDPGQRQLNGPQTTGRTYTNLSEPQHRMTRDDDVIVPMRDGANLLADVHRPDDDGHFPVLVSASPYPRQPRTSARRWGSSKPEPATSSCPAATST